MEKIKFLFEVFAFLALALATVLCYHAVKAFIKDKYSEEFKLLAMGSTACSIIGLLFLYLLKILF